MYINYLEEAKHILKKYIGKNITLSQIFDLIDTINLMHNPNIKNRPIRNNNYFNKYKGIVQQLESSGLIEPYQYSQSWQIMEIE